MQGNNHWCKCGNEDCRTQLSIFYVPCTGLKMMFIDGDFEHYTFVMTDDMIKSIIAELQDLLSKPSVNYFGNSDNTTFS